MNKKRLLILAKLLEMAARKDAKPKMGFNMEHYVCAGIQDRTGHACGTSACIAGWAVAAFDEGGSPETLPKHFFYIPGRAAELLGLDDDGRSELFHGDYDATPIQAARVLRHAAETGKIDWSVGGAP